MIDRIQWLGHSSIVIQGTPYIQIAPWRVTQSIFHPDMILIGHDHYDHCSQADVEKIRGENTQVIGNKNVAQIISDTTIIREWQSISIDNVNIKAIPAYSPNDIQHPKEEHGLGFVISMDFYDIYYTGDTQIIPEMELLHPDIILLPIDGYGRLSVDEAVEVVDMLKPRWVIPYNWGQSGEEATPLDAQHFKELVGGRAEVLLLPIT